MHRQMDPHEAYPTMHHLLRLLPHPQDVLQANTVCLWKKTFFFNGRASFFSLVLQWSWTLFGSLFDGSFGRPEVDSCREGLILHHVCFCLFYLEKVGCKWSIQQISVVALNCHIVILSMSILANPFWDDMHHPHKQDKLVTH